MDKNERRRFNKKEKLAAWLSQDGKSALSGKDLGFDFHADHKIPWSKGGKTEIENCQAVTPEENLKKGNKVADRFQWQDEFFAKYIQWTETDFFLCALPGAGKTKASIRAIRSWIEQGGVFVVVAPTLPIRRNWRKRLQEVGLYGDESFYGFLKEKYHGVLVTYSGLRSLSQVFKKLCSDRPVLLICDEVHHASENEDSTWGTDLYESFVNAKRRLLLSGTPVRSDKETTSFLKIEEYKDDDGNIKHRYKMDFLYDWPRALEDEVVRSIAFHRHAMREVHVTFPIKGKKTFNDKEDEWLNYALDETPFLKSILLSGVDKLEELRRSDPTAAGIVIAKNIGHAKVIYDLLGSLAQSPVIVTSQKEEGDESSIDIIDSFAKDNSKKWIVSVRQVSEGVDIPRLMVEVYLTNYVTELSFRQAIGRVVRRREDESDDQCQAHVFLPETPRLVKLAEKIERLQELAFKNPRGEPPELGTPDRGITIGGSESEFVGYVICGKQYSGDRATIIKQLTQKYKIAEHSAVLMLNDPNFAKGLKAGEGLSDVSPPTENPPWVEEDLLKTECNKFTKDLVRIRQRRQGYGDKYDKKIYSTLITRVNREFMIDGISQERMSVSQLQRKRENLIEAIMREEQW